MGSSGQLGLRESSLDSGETRVMLLGGLPAPGVFSAIFSANWLSSRLISWRISLIRKVLIGVLFVFLQ